jgi:hypothetical protein
MSEIIWKEKKRVWKRIGKCISCGYCCENENCVHFKDNLCLIYDSRDKDCKVCSQLYYKGKKKYNHKNCIDFPNHPYLNCLKTGKCGYKFIEGTI